MGFNEEQFSDDRDTHAEQQGNNQSNAYLVNDESNLTEKNLERNLYGNSEDNMKPAREGQAMGGQSFGKNSNTPAGDDKNNPSQNAGYTNPISPGQNHQKSTRKTPILK